MHTATRLVAARDVFTWCPRRDGVSVDPWAWPRRHDTTHTCGSHHVAGRCVTPVQPPCVTRSLLSVVDAIAEDGVRARTLKHRHWTATVAVDAAAAAPATRDLPSADWCVARPVALATALDHVANSRLIRVHGYPSTLREHLCQSTPTDRYHLHT